MVATDSPDTIEPETIGLIPAAGSAERLGVLPCSKEILPVGVDGYGRLRVAADDLLEAFAAAGITRAFVVLRPGKWDVAAQLGAGERHGLRLGYLLAERSRGVPDTLAAAEPFVRGARVAVGFPDILFHPRDAFVRMAAQLDERRSDGVVLGLMPTDAPERSDMVAFDADGGVRSIDIKPTDSILTHAWVLALWGPSFTRFLGDFVRGLDGGSERHLGHALQAWLHDDRPLDAVVLDGGHFHDIGTGPAYARRFAPAAGGDESGRE